MPIFQVYTEDTTKKSDTIVLRDEQLEAIKKAKEAFKESNFSTKKPYLKFLWNAKMRFGKTLCALQLAKEAGFQRTLIVTHRPVVDDGCSDGRQFPTFQTVGARIVPVYPERPDRGPG